MRRYFRRWLCEEAGQDLVEYALLASFIGLAGLAGYSAISTAIGNNYSQSNSSVQGLWEIPAPPAP
jgi:Flp pilus assembly pilin Flp